MKKLSLLLIFVILLCTACSNAPPPPANDDITPSIIEITEAVELQITDAELPPIIEITEPNTSEVIDADPLLATSTEIPTDAPDAELLTADEARTVAQSWLNERPDVQFTGELPNTLDNEYLNITVDGEEYYLFILDNPEAYWFSILVHTKTGALLNRFVSDGEFSLEEIEPLEDWYNRYYGE